MPIARTIEWQLTCSPEEADSRFRRALEALDMSPQGPPGQVHGKSKRAIMKNRWSAEASVTITPGAGGRQSHFHAVSRISMGRLVLRPWCRSAVAILVCPARRRRLIVVLRNVAMTCGPLPVRS
jgi:hypothetical protein